MELSGTVGWYYGMGVEMLLVILGRTKRSLRQRLVREVMMEIVLGPIVLVIILSPLEEDVPDLMTVELQLMAIGRELGLTDRLGVLGREKPKDSSFVVYRKREIAIEELIAQRVAEALANYEATRAANALEAKSQSQNGNDGENGNGRNGNRNHGDGGNNGNRNPNENGRGVMPVARRGLHDNIQGNVMPVEPTRLQDAIRLANSLMDQKLKGCPIRSAENKRKFESNQRDNHTQQLLFKRQNVVGSNVARAYMAGGNEGKVYAGPHPLFNKCKLHHVRPCT
ncbi:hypothetical protein Tco_0765946, partial [Tanacetum coccineum]